MHKRIIRLCYRKIIDAQSNGVWEKYVFDDTYTEFLLQFQFYNQEKKYHSFAALIADTPNAERLHFLVSSAATGYVQQLNGKIPDVTNALGKLFLPFQNFRFEIINSDVRDKSKHQVAISFYSDPLTWLHTIDNQLLIAVAEQAENEETLTEMFSMKPFLSIYSIK